MPDRSKNVSFYTYIINRSKDNTPIDDLADDIKRDRTFPKNNVTLGELQDYLDDKGATQKAIDACTEAWKEYKGEVSPVKKPLYRF